MAEKFNRTMVFDIQAEEKLIAVREDAERLGDQWLAIPNERQHPQTAMAEMRAAAPPVRRRGQ